MLMGDRSNLFIKRTEGKNNNFDVLRFFFAIAVLLTHCFVFVETQLHEPLEALTYKQISMGELAVNGFFAISGFLITASWLRSKGIIDYFKRRILRIYPGFLAAYLICVVGVGAIGAASVASYYAQLPWGAVIKNMLLLNNLDKLGLPPTYTIAYPNGINLNGALWTIKIEFECYILLALLGMCGALRRRLVILALCVATFSLYAMTRTPYFLEHLPLLGKLDLYSSHISFGLYFLIGASVYLYRDIIPYDRRLFWGAAVLIILSALTQTLYLVMPLCSSYLLFGAAFVQNANLARFAEKRDLSYGIYLYGWPVQLLVTMVLGKNLNPYVLFVVILPLICAIAMCSWYLIEAPCLSLIRKRHTHHAAAMAHPVVAVVPANSVIQTTQAEAAKE